MPPIAKILARLGELTQAKYATNKEPLGALGNVFMDSANTNPNYFAVPGRVPESDLAKLSAKHGVVLQPGGMGPGHIIGSAGSNSGYTQPKGSAQQMLQEFSDTGNRGAFAALSEAFKRGELSPHTELVGIDTMNAAKGAGAAKKLYAPFYEGIVGHPDAANMKFGLSANNMDRLGQHMSGAIEKFGDRAAHRLRIDNDQIAPVGDPWREAEYHAASTPMKVGILNAHLAPNTVARADDSLRLLLDQYKGLRPSTANTKELMDTARSLGVHEGVWTPSTDVDKNFFPGLAKLLGDINTGTPDPGLMLGNIPRSVGVDSLRRAAITYDAAGSGLTARNIASQPYLTDKLARKDGGSVPGPLSQVCGCG